MLTGASWPEIRYDEWFGLAWERPGLPESGVVGVGWRRNGKTLKTDEDDDTIIEEKIEPMVTLLPILLDFLGLFAERKDDYGSALFKVEHCPDNPQQDNTGDCRVFVIKYTQYLMHGYAISEVTQDKMHFFRRKLTFELYSHAMDKEENQVVSDLERD
ncbi:Ulp1 protease family, C-terminal catalytic domain containing protein [Trema orientale]|uniref:Ulp1 protease family, C-terminal catalytic domain containing protein n=1 Tax=Trema orientale TaxID=63057 RepID=A0A2P5DER2_TREOI|nr:Ulp1 protease family, C-terminal catalytic domain containing protein [Trema orientale]